MDGRNANGREMVAIRERETMLGRMIPRNRQVRWTLDVGRMPNHRWWSSISSDETANGAVISSRNYHDSRDRRGRRERERRLLPLTSICKGGEKGRRRVVERQEPRLFNIFVSVCLNVVYTTPKNHHRLMIWDQKRATRNKKKEREKKNKKDSEAKNSNIAGRIFRRRRFSSIPEFRIRHFKKYLTKSKYLPEN